MTGRATLNRSFVRVLGAISILLSLFVCAAPFEFVLATFPDDSFYYLTIARNLALGVGSTFDGIHATNGYHPLWCWMLVPVLGLLHDAPESSTRLVSILCIWITFAASVLVFHFARRAFRDKGAAVVAGFATFVVTNTFGTSGMESALSLLFVLLFLFRTASTERRGHGAAAGLQGGLLMALVVFARLDNAFIILSYFVAEITSFVKSARRKQESMDRFVGLTAEAITLAVIMGLYFIYNYLCFDTVMPISGALKTSFPSITGTFLFWHSASFMSRIVIVHSVVLTLVLCVGCYSRGLRRLLGWRDDRHIHAIRLWASGLVLLLLYNLLFVRWAGASSWYYEPYAVLASVAIGQWVPAVMGAGAFVLERRRGRVRAVPALVAVVLCACLGFRLAWKYSTLETNDFHIAAYSAATWVRSNSPRDAVFALKDAGAFGFFSKRHVVNLDGVVNNRAYQDALREEGIEAYLERESVDYLAQQSLWEYERGVEEGDYVVHEPEYFSRLHWCSAGTVTLRREEEVYRSQWVKEGRPTHFVIWRLSWSTYRSGFRKKRDAVVRADSGAAASEDN